MLFSTTSYKKCQYSFCIICRKFELPMRLEVDKIKKKSHYYITRNLKISHSRNLGKMMTYLYLTKYHTLRESKNFDLSKVLLTKNNVHCQKTERMGEREGLSGTLLSTNAGAKSQTKKNINKPFRKVDAEGG